MKAHIHLTLLNKQQVLQWAPPLSKHSQADKSSSLTAVSSTRGTANGYFCLLQNSFFADEQNEELYLGEQNKFFSLCPKHIPE